MTRLLPVLACAAALTAADLRVAPHAGDYLRLEVYKTGLLSGKVHVIEFPAYEGTLAFDPARPHEARLSLAIDAGALQVKDTWLSSKDLEKVRQHALKEMLDAAKHPRIRFRSTKVDVVEKDRYRVAGVLTIREREAVVEVQANGAGGAFEGEAKFRLSAFGLKPPSAALGAIGTRDEMRLVFRLTPVKESR